MEYPNVTKYPWRARFHGHSGIIADGSFSREEDAKAVVDRFYTEANKIVWLGVRFFKFTDDLNVLHVFAIPHMHYALAYDAADQSDIMPRMNAELTHINKTAADEANKLLGDQPVGFGQR